MTPKPCTTCKHYERSMLSLKVPPRRPFDMCTHEAATSPVDGSKLPIHLMRLIVCNIDGEPQYWEKK